MTFTRDQLEAMIPIHLDTKLHADVVAKVREMLAKPSLTADELDVLRHLQSEFIGLRRSCLRLLGREETT